MPLRAAAGLLFAATCLLLPARVCADPGVSATQLVIGEPSVFSGASGGLGVEAWRGSIAAFSEANDAGGVHGRRVRLVLADDAYEASRAIPAVLQLIRRDEVFSLFQSIGTPTIVKSLPVIYRYYTTQDLFLFAVISGAQPPREPPYDDAVFNVRASYRQEIAAMVDALTRAGRSRIGIFVQDDAYGTSGRDGVQRALASRGLSVAAETTYRRGQRFEESTRSQVELLRAGHVDAVISVCTYQACAALVRDARESGWSVPIMNLSFSGPDQMLELLRAEQQRTAVPLPEGLVNTLVIPSFDDLQLPLVQQYRAAMDRYQPAVPSEVGDGSYWPSNRYSYGSLEGYLNARVFLLILQRTGAALTRRGFISTAEAMHDFDIGLGVPLHFSHDRHQALDKVWFMHATEKGWERVDDPVPFLR